MLENSLKTLFDFQRFERSSALQNVINETLDRYSGKVIPLADDGIAMAAGGVGPEGNKSQVKPDDKFGIL